MSETNEAKIDEAVIVDFDCTICFDTGIILGTADYNDERVIIGKLCECVAKKLISICS